MLNKLFFIILVFAYLFTLAPNAFAQEIEKDSTLTSFRKGRWFTGLSGSISSGTIENSTSGKKSSSNRYGIEISTGKFIKNRLLVGFLFSAHRDNFESDFVKTTESIFIGPQASYYFSKSRTGSIFFKLSPGFVIYRDQTSLLLEDTFTELISEGNGFGFLTTLGYSYVLHDRITFDLGLNLNVSWISVEQNSETIEVINDVNIVLSDLSFSFGFNVLLEEFFF